MGILISIGKWGGIYWNNGWTKRLCLGWIALTFIPTDGDYIMASAALWGEFNRELDRFLGPVLVHKTDGQITLSGMDINNPPEEDIDDGDGVEHMDSRRG